MADVIRQVVDASIVAKWHLNDEGYTDLALEVLDDLTDGRTELVAPAIIVIEVASSLLKAVRRRRVGSEQASASVQRLSGTGIQLVHEPLLAKAFSMARTIGCSFYDALYLATAEDLGVPFLHADAKLHRAIGGRLAFELWIEDHGQVIGQSLDAGS